MNFVEDRKCEKKASIILDYFKLLYIEKLTYNEGIDSFKMLGGDTLFKRLLKAEEEKVISLDTNNYMMVQELKINIEKSLENTHSISEIYEKEFSDLEWLNNIVSELEPEDKANETIVNLSAYGTYNEIFADCNRIPTTKEKIMQKRINEINKLTQKRENN